MQTSKDEAWKLYSSWQKSGIYCPALEKFVIISRKGWNHITGKDGRKRIFGDVYRRLKLLPYAKKLIENSTMIQNSGKFDNGTKFVLLQGVFQIQIGNEKVLSRVSVILQEDKKGNIIFYSVSDRKIRV